MKRPKLKDLFTKASMLRKFIPTMLLTTALTTALSTSSTATLVTHEWEKNHRGYSVELVPGTDEAGIPAEYVAAGTVYDVDHPYPGWHFMHLDDMGNVLSERTSWAQLGDEHEFRVVDIACQSSSEFWITIQARDRSPGNENDYIYLAGVDITGNDLPMNPAIVITSNNSSHNNLYPTHSYYADNGYLYLCGYAGDNTQFPNEPDKYYSDKYGMFLRVDVNNPTPATNYYFWDCGSSIQHNQDYDMALKIAPNEYGKTFPLLVTGAITTSDPWLSGVFVGKFDASGYPVTLNGFYPTLQSPYPGRPTGVYGIDIRGGIYGEAPVGAPDVAVLVNSFDANDVSNTQRSYGIARIKNDLTLYPNTNQSYKYVVGTGSSWAKQFSELHGNSTDWYSDNHIYIFGEQTKFYSTPSYMPTGALYPNSQNVNPFITKQYLGQNEWDPTNGFSIPTTAQCLHSVYLSSEGTSANSMDYMQGSLGTNSIREDITRLYTFSSLGRYYDDPNAHGPRHEPGMVLPIANPFDEEPKVADEFLVTKHLKLELNYQETSCNKWTVDYYTTMHLSHLIKVGLFVSILYENVNTGNGYSLFSLVDQYNMFPSITDCSTGRYKPTGIASVHDDKTITLYPNPTSSELNIKLSERTDYTVTLTDMTGKVVYNQSGNGAQAKLNLPQLSAGIYLATITTEDVIHTEKLVIE